MKIIDSHQHFWKYNPERDVWIDDSMKVLQQDFLPENLKEELRESEVLGTVAVQADPSDDETVYLHELAQENPWILGVVGWTDLRSPDLYQKLQHYHSFQKLKGFRHLLQSEAPGFMLQSSFIQGVRLLGEAGYTFDLLIKTHQLSEAVSFLRQIPEVPVVLDHLAKPDMSQPPDKNWIDGIKALAERDQCFCKISGMVTETHEVDLEAAHFNDHMDIALEYFGPNRLMYGSDWPVCLLKTSYAQVKSITADWISKLSKTEQTAIWSGNTRRFYNLLVHVQN